MKIRLADTTLFFDVEGCKLAPDGPRMKEKPTLLLLHGGPGYDHSIFKPAFSRLADIVQIVYLDHRGHGRSDRSVASRWCLGQWADDIVEFCDALEIREPIVLGASFGGHVAQAYATRHPHHPGKLILYSTSPRFRLGRVLDAFARMGGQEAREIASQLWQDPGDAAFFEPYRRTCMPLYNRTEQDPDSAARPIMNMEVLTHYFTHGGEGHRFDFIPSLNKVVCPTLVIAGDEDPIAPLADSEDIVAALPEKLVKFRRFSGCGHCPHRDDEDAVFNALRDFISE